MSKSYKKDFRVNLTLVFVVLLAVSFFIYGFFTSKKIPKFLSGESVPLLIKPEKIPDLKLLGKAELSYAGGTEGRHKNIELGISRINGKVVPPGEEFSFKKALGSVTLEDGFSEERVFLNGEVTKGLGGGLCQISTTLFQTAISSGLPVTERKNHSYSVSYYDTGLDATYADPGPDFKFLNDTAYPITIKGKTENEKVVFEIYGVPDGRISSTTELEISDIVDFPATKYIYVPELEEDQSKCINKPQIGYTAKIKYMVFHTDGEVKEQIFSSKYRPLQRVCFIVGDEISSFDINKVLSANMR